MEVTSAQQSQQTNYAATGTNTGPNSPELTPDGKQHMVAISDIGQAIGLVKALQAENKDRSLKNGRIQFKLNAERPFEQTRLDADGLGWKSNFTTKPLSMLADKVVPRFSTAVKKMRYITASKLPDRFPNADAKTECFRREITETVRGREGFDDFISELAQENTLFGYCAASWLDRYSWFPKFHRQDHFLIPRSTKHTAKSAPMICLLEENLIHELFSLIRDPVAAQRAGWNVNEVINSINNAVPKNLRSPNVDPIRIYADLMRESAILTSFVGSKAVEIWHVFVAEVDGRISHVAYDSNSEKQLFWREKQFERMADVAAFFSLQHGNGNLHGSKGLGRDLYSIASILDRARNEVVDRLQLSGKMVLQCEDKDIKRFRMSVIGNAILIGSGYNVQQFKIDGNVEAFFSLDKFLSDLLDQLAGSTSPQPNEGERVTKAAIEIKSAREEERRDTLIERFLTQFARMVSTMQRRLCDPKSIESDALEMQKRLLLYMSPEELEYLSRQPAVSTVEDYSDEDRQRIALIAQDAKGNPLYNALELEKRKLTAIVSSEFAKAVLLPANDPTEQAENVREQMLELLAIQAGQDVPVSPRDNHAIHADVCQKAVTSQLQAAAQDPNVWPVLGAIGDHLQAHIQAAEQMGQAQQMAGPKQFLAKLDDTLQKLMAHQKEVVSQAAQNPQAPAQPQDGQQAQSPEAQQAQAQTQTRAQNVKESITINFKDLPASVQAQVEQSLGFIPAPTTERPTLPAANES